MKPVNFLHLINQELCKLFFTEDIKNIMGI